MACMPNVKSPHPSRDPTATCTITLNICTSWWANHMTAKVDSFYSIQGSLTTNDPMTKVCHLSSKSPGSLQLFRKRLIFTSSFCKRDLHAFVTADFTCRDEGIHRGEGRRQEGTAGTAGEKAGPPASNQLCASLALLLWEGGGALIVPAPRERHHGGEGYRVHVWKRHQECHLFVLQRGANAQGVCETDHPRSDF